MKIAKSLLTITLALVFVFSAVGCGGATAVPAPAAPATAAPATAAPATAAPEPTPVVGEFGTCDHPIVLWSGLTGSDAGHFAKLLTQFATENPDACVASQGYVWDTFFQKYPTATAAGSPPDMVIFHATEVAQMASEGLMTPLDDIMYADGSAKASDYNPTLMQAITVDGHIMAVPFDNHGWILWYNTKIITDAGLDPNNLPKNGAEFIQWAQKITTDVNGKHPLDAGFDKSNVQVWAHEFTWANYTEPVTLWQFGGGVLSPDSKTVILDSPESIAAIQYWHDLMYKYYVAPPAIPGKAWAGDLYKANRLAFMWEGTWTKGFMDDNPDIAAVTKTAFINSLAPDGKQVVKFDSHVMVIPAGVDAAGIARAKKLITWLSQNGAAWADSGQVPANLAVQASLDPVKYKYSVSAAQEFAAIGRTDMSTKYFVEIQTAYQTAVGNALASADADVATNLKAGAEAIRAILARP